jgi:hypothetical protein
VYSLYELNLANMLGELDAEFLETLFDQVESELTPFYNDPAVVLQSEYDRQATSFFLWQENMADKKLVLTERLESMREQLNSNPDN